MTGIKMEVKPQTQQSGAGNFCSPFSISADGSWALLVPHNFLNHFFIIILEVWLFFHQYYYYERVIFSFSNFHFRS